MRHLSCQEVKKGAEMKKGEVWITVGEWYKKTKAVLLRKDDYVFKVSEGRTASDALKAAAKKLRSLAAECTKLAKGDKDENS